MSNENAKPQPLTEADARSLHLGGFGQTLVERVLATVAALEEARARVAELEKLYNKERSDSQHFVDATCYYRNLAVTLGMKPEQARNPHDRSIVEDYAKNGGFVFAKGDWTVADEIREQEEHWAKVERAEKAEARVAELALDREKEAQRIEGALLTKLHDNPQFRGGVERAVLMLRCGPTHTKLDAALEAKP